ncbi:ABC transporter permease [Lactobacillus xylocopicola]|uniref:ABC transporter permease n=1 Tax=Lactobacillus xylocopicola TaxID=2976676 RepID=A0ABM8BHK0_9LACO|nr:ABC transporter permease [Lactobacillus xylocopicola]BDR60754.1 ABC transporter permease [Lactobacillus xylocopicola]
MRELAQARLRKNVQQSLKYLMLVFNDFFILALMFLFGGLMFWYAQAMKQLPTALWFYRPLVGLLLGTPLLVGKLVTLLKPADLQFLLPQDDGLRLYLKPLFSYSLIVPTIILLLLAGILFPFAALKAQLPTLNYLFAIVLVLLAKTLQLKVQEHNLFAGRKLALAPVTLSLLLLLAVAMVKPNSIYGLVVLVAVCIILLTLRPQASPLVDWPYAVDQEEKRKNRVYTAFSMFTDVKEKQISISRRPYLDFLLPRHLDRETPNRFLYRRALLRNPEYLNLLVRMTAFAVLVSWLVQNTWWALGLTCLVVFLTVYQLLPLVCEFDDNIMYRVYPIERTQRGRDLITVLALALLLQWLIIGLFWLVLLPINLQLWEAIGSLVIWTNVLLNLYLPYKIKKGKIN